VGGGGVSGVVDGGEVGFVVGEGDEAVLSCQNQPIVLQ